MKRLALPLISLLAAAWATTSVVRTHPVRSTTDPPSPPPVSSFRDTIAAVGLVEPSTENISIGSHLSGVVARVFVTAGARVKAGDSLFQLDLRHLDAELAVRRQDLAVSRARTAVAEARLADHKERFAFVEKLEARAISAEEVSHRRNAVDIAAAEAGEARAQAAANEAKIAAIETDIDRSTVRAPIDAEVLQVRLRVGEYAAAAKTDSPIIVLGESKPLHVRVDVDEHEAWRVRQGAVAIGHVRGNAVLEVRLRFVRFEPFVIPKHSLTGDSTERVDTRVLQVIYAVDGDDARLFVGQQLDVFIDGDAS